VHRNKKKKTNSQKEKDMKIQYYEQTVGKGKGRQVRFWTDIGTQVQLIDLKSGFPYLVSKANFEKYYKEIPKPEKKTKKKKGVKGGNKTNSVKRK